MGSLRLPNLIGPMNSVLTNVILVVHILIAIALTGAVLLQRSEGGALGIGGGGAGGGVFSGRGVTSALVRTTMILAGGFFLTSLALTTIANRSRPPESVVPGALTEPGDATLPQGLDPTEAPPVLPSLDETPAPVEPAPQPAPETTPPQ
jgi:preprotein translocase subunit SecG